MFGFDDLLLGSLIGGGLGALTSHKPLKGALLGAGLGAGASYLPGILSTAPVQAASAATPAEALAGSPWAGFTPGADISSGYATSNPGLLSQTTGALKTAQPFMTAANTGLSVAKQLAPTPFQAPPVAALQQHPLNMQGLLGDQEQQMAYDQQAKRRALMARYGSIG